MPKPTVAVPLIELGQLKPEFMSKIVEHMESKGFLERTNPKDKNCTNFIVFYRKPEDWAKLIYDWVNLTGRNGSVCTVYEIHSGDDSVDQGIRFT